MQGSRKEQNSRKKGSNSSLTTKIKLLLTKAFWEKASVRSKSQTSGLSPSELPPP